MRIRRTPEEARTAILDAAERVFATQLPDVAGLKDVAREAGISHALITHYFGTYDAMIEATLERRFAIVRAEIIESIGTLVSDEADVKALLRAYRAAVAKAASNPATARLVTWAILSDRARAADFFPHRVQGLRLLVDAMSARSRVPREDLEFAVVASLGIAAVSSFGRPVLAGSLGRKPSKTDDADFERRADAMFDAYLQSAERP